jgi:hypothetical protein
MANDGDDADSIATFQDMVKGSLRKWRTLRRSDPTKIVKMGDTTPGGREYWSIVKDIARLAETDERGVHDVLLNRNVLVPQAKPGSSSDSDITKPARKLYGPLLESLGPEFVQSLALYLVEFLNARPTDFDWIPNSLEEKPSPEETSTRTKSAIYVGAQQWIAHFLAPTGRNFKWLQDPDEIVTALLAVPRKR